jgi:hypothetical protein
MSPRHAVLITTPPRSLHPLQWSYLHTGMKPPLKSCVSHSYENSPGVGLFFPFWLTLSLEGNSSSATQRSCLPSFSASGIAACGDSLPSFKRATFKPSNTQTALCCNPFRIRTSRRFAFFAPLTLLESTHTSHAGLRKSFRIRTSMISTRNPFRIRTSEKRWGGGVSYG